MRLGSAGTGIPGACHSTAPWRQPARLAAVLSAFHRVSFTSLMQSAYPTTSFWRAAVLRRQACTLRLPTLPTLPHDAMQAYFCGDVSAPVRWGMQDLSFYVQGYHHNVIEVHNETNGFFMRRVTARVNPYVFQNNAILRGHGHKEQSFNGTSVSRDMPWMNGTDPTTPGMWGTSGALVLMHGRNWEITDCDLVSDGSVVYSFDWDYFRHRHGSMYGRLARNKMTHGTGACHEEDAWKQIIVEDNHCRGMSLFSGGWAIGTSMGGFAQHLYHARNTEEMVWGNDRETCTFDDAGGSYFGPVASTNGTTLTTLYDTKPSNSDRAPEGWQGGTIMIVNGTGQGQMRRIVKAGIFVSPTPSNRTWVVDRPWTVEPDSTSFIQIYAFRGKIIFEQNLFRDVGPWQTYGTSGDLVVAGNEWVRCQGVFIEGQWRGWVPAENMQAPEAQAKPSNSPSLGGPSGVGIQPTTRNMILENTVSEPHSAALYNDGIWKTGWIRVAGLGESGGKYDLDVCPPFTWANVVRGNDLGAGGGIHIGETQAAAVVEFNTAPEIIVQLPQLLAPVVVRNNTAKVTYHCCHSSPNLGP
eukprot:m.86074 g.86074  ORF g.86074 m.86074 type:complete len:580 (+) comp14864_c0_seq1:1233-2972(+)